VRSLSRNFFAAGLLALAWPGAPAHAIEADQFFGLCNNRNDEANYNFCLGYTFAIAEALYNVPERTVCFDGVQPETLLDAVISFMADQPERDGNAGPAVAAALEASFPCQ
jgi:hypothetical protein